MEENILQTPFLHYWNLYVDKSGTIYVEWAHMRTMLSTITHLDIVPSISLYLCEIGGIYTIISGQISSWNT